MYEHIDIKLQKYFDKMNAIHRSIDKMSGLNNINTLQNTILNINQPFDLAYRLSKNINQMTNVINRTLPHMNFLEYNKMIVPIYQAISSFQLPLQNFIDSDEEKMKAINDVFSSSDLDSFEMNDIVITKQDDIVIQEAVIEIVSDSTNWQQKMIEIVDRFKKTNPIIYYIVLYLLATIVSNITINVVSDYITETIQKAKIKESPESISKTIYIVEKGADIIIIDSVPYYFQIQYVNEETGEIIFGWMSKKVLTYKSNSGENIDDSDLR